MKTDAKDTYLTKLTGLPTDQPVSTSVIWLSESV